MTKLHARWDSLDRGQREKLQLARLRSFLDKKVIPFSKHYREAFSEIGVTAQDIQSLEDWAQIPFTSKVDLLPTEDGQSPARDFVLIPDEAVLRSQPAVLARGILRGKKNLRKELAEEFRPIMMTSTTGRSTESVPFLYTQHDLDNLAITGERTMLLGESAQEYRHINMFPYAPHLAYWQTYYSGIGHNTFMVGSGGGKVMGTTGNVTIASKIDPDVLIGMPTFIYHVLQVALEDGVRLRNLKTIVLGGEKVPDGMRRKLRAMAKELGAVDQVAIISTYGFTEAKMAFPECVAKDGSSSGFHLFPDLALVEIVDPVTGKPVGEGEPGEIVYTSLDSRGSVVMRYRTGDQIEHGIHHGVCDHCGRHIPRLMGKISRVSDVREVDLGKIKGTLVNFSELEHILDDFDDIGSWQIELRKRDDDPYETDELHVHLHCITTVSRSHLEVRVDERFLATAEIKPNEIHFHTGAEMRERQGVGVELKEQRFVDNRAKPEVDQSAVY